ncbi:unnamed protein product [Leptosia nina]|uniref:Shavenoid isoform B-like N-terminal domain-containing protein n=1 Tax=Leptosia nina TaxID=320188 RepID=A0AAV1JSX4_9NEOP
MALVILLILVIDATLSTAAHAEMALANVTRFATGDFFTLTGTDCGMTRCMEVSHGTALATIGGAGCTCQCRGDTPAFREDRRICVNQIDECPMASFGRGSTKPQIPFVFLPLKGQIIYPSKEIVFTDVEDAICAVTSAQYLSSSGWVTLRDLLDNDVPFGLYRDEGSTYLQWKGSSALHTRLEGRLVATHVLCSAPPPARLATSCATFRVAGATHNALLDVRSIPFHAGETVTSEPATQSRGLSVLESLAIGVCVLMLVFIYAAGIIFYIHYKQKQRKKPKDPEMNISNAISSENESTLDSRINMDSMRLKTNPLMDSMRNDYMNDAGLSDVSEQTEDTIDSSPPNYHRFQEPSSSIVSAVVHAKRKKPTRPTIRATSTPERLNERLHRRSASPEMERAPHSDVSILHCNIDNNVIDNIPHTHVTNEEPVIRRKLYFNPVFFETDHLKNPPAAAVDFLNKLREVMSIAKEKMTSKRFIPNLSDIAEEESYHTIDLGWDIPCAKRGRRFSAISLKRENSRRQIHCGGCPGCDSSVRGQGAASLMRSNSCKTCVSDDYKQKIVQRWLEDVPLPSANTARPTRVAKVSGTPRVIEPKGKEEMRINPAEPLRNEDSETLIISEAILKELISEPQAIESKDHSIKNTEPNESSNIINPNYVNHEKRSGLNHATRKVRKRLPPPPPPPVTDYTQNEEEPEPVLPEVKEKMEAVIRELNRCKRVKPDDKEILLEGAAPKIIIPVIAADSQYPSNNNIVDGVYKKEFYIQRDVDIDFDSLERTSNKQRRFSLDFASDLPEQDDVICQQNLEKSRERLSRSWRDLKNAIDNNFSSLQPALNVSEMKKLTLTKDIFLNGNEPIYNDIDNPGPLTIEVRGSPVGECIPENEDFDPDTLDRKPKKPHEPVETKKCVEKILLKSGGSFKNKINVPQDQKEKTPPEAAFTRKIGSLRQIYEAKTRAHDESFYERRGSISSDSQKLNKYVEKIDLLHSDQGNLKPPLPSKQKNHSDLPKTSSTRNSPQSDRHQSSEERDRFPPRSDNNSRKSGRRSVRTRTRRLDVKKTSKTEDSGYLSTDSNESKRRARYLMQLKPKLTPDLIAKPVPTLSKGLQIESDTDELESLCDGRSESGGESVETDSVFFGNYNDSKRIYEELGLDVENREKIARSQEQIDSGFAGETNIILSGDSDSEHKSVISIVTGRDGRTSVTSNSTLDGPPFPQCVEC